MTWIKPNTSYWDEKFTAWWHDPIDKVLSIPGHEERGAAYLQIFGLDRPNEDTWKKADAMAAGFERGQIPSYSRNENQNGAVDYVQCPLLTHPTSDPKSEQGGLLRIEGPLPSIDTVFPEVQEFLKKTIGMKANKGDYAARFENDPDRFAQARMLYTHLVLRFVLAERNIGGLGALWHRLPADSRFPDHSIWQHNALCSAFSSCISLGGDPDEVGLLVFSITPVQGFIARARKLRDFWSGSVLLSWLAFSGLRWVMENLGVDHVLYPSLIDQPLVNAWLEREWEVEGPFQPLLWKNQLRGPASRIASLPNKFLFLAPFSKAKIIGEELELAVNRAWEDLARLTAEGVAEQLALSSEEAGHLQHLFTRQTSSFWNCQWAASRLVVEGDQTDLSALLDEDVWKRQRDFLRSVTPILKARGYSIKDASRGIYYSASHNLVQSVLAAEKMCRLVARQEEPGEKCQMCGEFEVLHSRPWQEGQGAESYTEHVKAFWRALREEQKSDVDFKENEQLCAICTLKRLLPVLLKGKKDHPLSHILGTEDGFPSTTEMALQGYFKRKNITERQAQRTIAQNLHNNEEFLQGGKIRNIDKYYALLIMDGDHMGRLVNGESIASTWEGIMHPDVARRFVRPDFNRLYRDVWRKIYKPPATDDEPDLRRRLVTPAIHAAISEALGDFSLYGVTEIIERHEGRLIYAGGDDVCAVLPSAAALDAAREISAYYASAFRFIDAEGCSRLLGASWRPEAGKLSVNLGMGEDISISAAVLICHHKESLSQMIARGHELLASEAKARAGRNACAIEVRKRHGGARVFTRKWTDSRAWDAFRVVASLSGGSHREISHALLYRLETMRPGIEAILEDGDQAWERLVAFFEKQLDRSGLSIGMGQREMAIAIAEIVWDRSDKDRPFKSEGLLVAGFLGGEGNDDGLV